MKVIDRREITFDAEALRFAITKALPTIKSFRLEGVRPRGVRLRPGLSVVEILNEPGQQIKAVPLTAELLIALLVSYCIHIEIPVPRNSEKTIRVEEEQVVLSITTHFAIAPEPVEVPRRVQVEVDHVISQLEWRGGGAPRK